MGRLKAFSILFTIIFLCCVLIVPVFSNSEIPEYPSSANLPPITYSSGEKAFLYYRYETGVWGYVVCDVSGNENTSILPHRPEFPSFTGYLNVSAKKVYELDGQSWVLYNSSNHQGNFYPYPDPYLNTCRIIVSVSQGIHSNVHFTVDSSNWNNYFSPDYNSWYDNIFNGIQNWFGGALDVLATPFTLIADGLQGVWQAVKDLVTDLVEELKSLFIPSVNILPLIQEEFTDKFPIINQVGDLFTNLFNPGSNEPIFQIVYDGMLLKIIDFTMFTSYMPLIRNFTGVFLLLSFLTREVKRLPGLLRGRD